MSAATCAAQRSDIHHSPPSVGKWRSMKCAYVADSMLAGMFGHLKVQYAAPRMRQHHEHKQKSARSFGKR